MKDRCFNVEKIIAAEDRVCEVVVARASKAWGHYVCQCHTSNVSDERNTFVDIFTIVFDVQFTVDLFTMEGKLIVNTLLYVHHVEHLKFIDTK